MNHFVWGCLHINFARSLLPPLPGCCYCRCLKRYNKIKIIIAFIIFFVSRFILFFHFLSRSRSPFLNNSHHRRLIVARDLSFLWRHSFEYQLLKFGFGNGNSSGWKNFFFNWIPNYWHKFLLLFFFAFVMLLHEFTQQSGTHRVCLVELLTSFFTCHIQ